MHRLSADEARGAVEAVEQRLSRPSGLGDVVFRIETPDGHTVSGRIVERDGESSAGGLILGAMSYDTSHRFVRWDEIVWIGAGLTDD
jgi:hypothetical protein